MTIKSHESFIKDIENHVLTVKLDQGLYRDMTFAKPDSSCMLVNITTRNGFLFYTGDMGSFTFRRTPDMFDFFRNKDGGINPCYWAEKLEAVDRFGGHEEFSESIANNCIDSRLLDFLSELDMDDPEDEEKATQAKSAVFDFKRCTDSYNSMVEAYNDWDADEAGGMKLDDFFDGSFNTHTSRLIWCLRAIVHVINLYDQQTQGEANA